MIRQQTKAGGKTHDPGRTPGLFQRAGKLRAPDLYLAVWQHRPAAEKQLPLRGSAGHRAVHLQRQKGSGQPGSPASSFYPGRAHRAGLAGRLYLERRRAGAHHHPGTGVHHRGIAGQHLHRADRHAERQRTERQPGLAAGTGPRAGAGAHHLGRADERVYRAAAPLPDRGKAPLPRHHPVPAHHCQRQNRQAGKAGPRRACCAWCGKAI